MKHRVSRNKLIIAVVLLLGITGIPAILFKKNDNTSPRARFEAFLLKEYRNAPRPLKNKDALQATDQPDMAAFQEYLMTLDPATGTVPRERLLLAYEQTRQIMAEKSGRSDIQWEGTGTEMGGRTRMIMYDPNDPTHKKVWAGGVTGGLWYNDDITDANSPWVPVGDFWSCLNIRCMAYDPNNTQTFYFGTGEVETAMQTYRESSGKGVGIWKSTDGGQTWNLMPSTIYFDYVTKILVRNENQSSVIYVGVASGYYQGLQIQPYPSDGLFRSTDGGNTWQQVLPNITGLNVPYAVSDIAETTDGRIFVGTRPNVRGDGAATILYSDNGTSWIINETYKNEILNSSSFTIPGRVVLATAPSDKNVVYALIASGYINPNNNFKYYYCYHILRSADKGILWVKKNLPDNLTSGFNFATIAWHALDVGIDPNNANNVYIGGLDVHKTTNGGNSWSRVSDWSLMYFGGGPLYIHADQHVILFEPGSSSTILMATDGGIFFTANGNTDQPSFEQRNKNFNTLQFYTCAIKPVPGSENYIGGLQDNGTLFYSGTPLTILDMISGGDGSYCFYDENDPLTSITSTYYNQYYVHYDNQHPNYLGDWQSGIFVNPADYDSDLKNLYANATDFIGNYQNSILRINDVPGFPTGTFVALNTDNPVYFSAVRRSPHSPQGETTLFLGTQAGKLYKVQHAESTPVATEITGTDFPTANISCIAVGNSDDTLLVTFSNYGVPSVWQTYNGGQTWQNKETNLPEMPVRWVIYHPWNSRQAMLATETGTWSTYNLDQENTFWEPTVDGMGNVRTDMLCVRKSDNTVLAATHGRGFFTTSSWGVITGDRKPKIAEFRIFPNPTTGMIHLSVNSAATGKLDIRIFDSGGKIIYSDQYPAGAGNNEKQIDLEGNPKGQYIVALRKDGTDLGTRKIIVY